MVVERKKSKGFRVTNTRIAMIKKPPGRRKILEGSLKRHKVKKKRGPKGDLGALGNWETRQ